MRTRTWFVMHNLIISTSSCLHVMTFYIAVSASSSKAGRLSKRPIIIESDDEGDDDDFSQGTHLVQSIPNSTSLVPSESTDPDSPPEILPSKSMDTPSILSMHPTEPSSESSGSASTLDTPTTISDHLQTSSSSTSTPAPPVTLTEHLEPPTVLHEVKLPGPSHLDGTSHSSEEASVNIATIPVPVPGSLAIAKNSNPATGTVNTAAAAQVSDLSSSFSASALDVSPNDSFNDHPLITTSELHSNSGQLDSQSSTTLPQVEPSDVPASLDITSRTVLAETLQPADADIGETVNKTVLGKRKQL